MGNLSLQPQREFSSRSRGTRLRRWLPLPSLLPYELWVVEEAALFAASSEFVACPDGLSFPCFEMGR